MHPLLVPVLIPAALGILGLLVPRRLHAAQASLSVLGTGGMAAAALPIVGTRASLDLPWMALGGLDARFALRADAFSSWALAFAAVVALLAALYSAGWWRDREPARGRHHALVCLTASAAGLALLADDMLLLLVAWELVTLMLFLFSVAGREEGGPGAAKAFAILGVGDVALIIAVVLLGVHRGGDLSLARLAASPLPTDAAVPAAAFALLLVASAAKAGAMPLHSWIPTMSTGTHPAAMALLPGALDKVLGIYLLARVSADWFVPSPLLQNITMSLGAVTILGGVFMAMVQHDLRRLLAFHAVSQVGYMLLGIGTGTYVGVMGGLFHMANNALYKSCLFLGAGVVERETGTTDLSRLGGLVRGMPVTFGCMFVAALSISGIPPTNGFASKWLVYQACVAANQPVFLVAALFGSVLTLASFVKVLHSVFWGARPARWDGVRESGGLGIPVALIVLAAGCVALGVFADAPLEHFFGPAAGLAQGGAGALSGAAAALAPLHGPALASALALPAAVFAPAPVTGLLLLGTLAALTLAYLGQMRVRRVGSAFVGGEPIDREVNRFPGPEFYRTVADLPWLGPVLRAAEAGRLDPYEAARRAGSPLVALLRRLHTGLLQDYLFWCLLGAAVVAAVVLWR